MELTNDTYKTIESPSEGIFKDKGSKFISFAYPISNEEEIKPIITDLKKQFYDARHHCFAFRIGYQGEQFRANDDGEPSSTAGKPILGQLLSNEITNVIVVVVRYFGGTKLGVPGLINAYKNATIDALENATIIEKTIDIHFNITFDYIVMNDVMKIIKDLSPNIIKQDFELVCNMQLSIRKSESEQLREKLSKVTSLTIND
ncbi:MAG: YigZ family protein [Bacteroidales bacterium]|nr:YigZ family protein [Bacteroidales bacterium]